MNTRNNKGSLLISTIIAVFVIAIGVGSVAVYLRHDAENRQHVAAQTQRATYSTVQAEAVAQGIDPTGIINPLSSVATLDTSTNPNASNNGNLGNMRSNEGGFYNNGGGAGTNNLNLDQVNNTGGRSGSGGDVIVAGGTDTSHVTGVVLAAPSAAVSGPLTSANFPATGWFILPSNPPGTTYRYTTDGSSPTATSAIWNTTNASLITSSNFPSTLKIQAYHANTDYSPSPVTTLSSLTYRLDVPLLSRATTPAVSNYVVTFSEQFGTPGNGVSLSAPASANGIATTIYYTTDGSDPTVSGTRAVAAGSFKIPQANWTWDGVVGHAATATVKYYLAGPNGNYVSSATVAASFANQPTSINNVVFSISSSGGPVASGTSVNFSSAGNVTPVTIRYNFGADPTPSSTASSSATLP
jgi:hypothetical protein